MSGTEDTILQSKEQARTKWIRVAGIGFLIFFVSGIVDILLTNIFWHVFAIFGFFLVIIGLWMARKNYT